MNATAAGIVASSFALAVLMLLLSSHVPAVQTAAAAAGSHQSEPQEVTNSSAVAPMSQLVFTCVSVTVGSLSVAGLAIVIKRNNFL